VSLAVIFSLLQSGVAHANEVTIKDVDNRYGSIEITQYLMVQVDSGTYTLGVSEFGVEAEELIFTYTYFTANQKFDVYSAPSVSSYRGANDKACVSTNGPVYVAGWDHNWLLVMYDTNNGGVRVGYVRRSAISDNISAPTLEFSYTLKKCTRSVQLTDDPETEKEDITRLSSGKQVTYLASYNNGTSWAYIETTVDGKTVRGFIPADALN